MAQEYEVLYLGQFALIDTEQGNDVAENADVLLGSYGSADNPLYFSTQNLQTVDLSEDDNLSFDTDNGGGYDYFRIFDGEPQAFDAVATYDAILTYYDGTTETISAVIFQDVDGNTYLAPELEPNSDQFALTEKPIQSLSLTSVQQDTGDMYGEREAGDMKMIIEGSPFDDDFSIYGIYTDTNDFLYGGGGNDSIVGGAGNDRLFGGSGDDSILAGADNDTISGGTGNDTITTGSGNDLIILSETGGDDIITDFDLSDPDGDGLTTDQLDVSSLRNSDGSYLAVSDVTVSDDGFGNALLTFPEGETVILQGVAPSQMASQRQLINAGIPCFTPGVSILTPFGERRVEDLRPGDLVTTRDNGPQPIAWTGRRHLGSAELACHPNLRPIMIRAGAFDNDRDLLVSPQHAVLTGLRDRGDETLVRATHVARMNGGQVRVAQRKKQVTYIHVMFDRHQLIKSNGLWSESYYPGPHALAMMENRDLLELFTLFPNLADGVESAIGATARTVARRRDLPNHLKQLHLCGA